MERRSFIKNTFGTIIGYALLPKLITENKVVDTITPSNVVEILVRKGHFRIGDIVKANDGYQYYITHIENGKLICKNLICMSLPNLVLIEKESYKNREVFRVCSAYSEL